MLHIRNRKGKANTQRGASRFVDELIARVCRAGHTGRIVIRADSGFENHKQLKDRDRRGIEFSIGVKQSKTIRKLIEQIPETAWVTIAGHLETGQAQIAVTIPMLIADHRDHPTIELAIRDLKDQALAHFPSGRYHANSAWTVIAALAHNLGRWSTQIGQPDRPVQTVHTRRRQLLRIPGRLTRTSRKWTLRMPSRRPWQNEFTTVLNTIRALPALT